MLKIHKKVIFIFIIIILSLNIFLVSKRRDFSFLNYKFILAHEEFQPLNIRIVLNNESFNKFEFDDLKTIVNYLKKNKINEVSIDANFYLINDLLYFIYPIKIVSNSKNLIAYKNNFKTGCEPIIQLNSLNLYNCT
jgi:hypothetical protein